MVSRKRFEVACTCAGSEVQEQEAAPKRLCCPGEEFCVTTAGWRVLNELQFGWPLTAAFVRMTKDRIASTCLPGGAVAGGTGEHTSKIWKVMLSPFCTG